MKNFKRVISAVIALALSASTLVAVSASKFADVDNTNYAEAIDVLAALDVIHGYEEEGGLVFKPDGEITRAEAAVMIVGALNMNKDAQAAAGSSKFTDVNEQTAWAQGYVNVGVAQGYINGMDATTFAPQQNVTYAQLCVMLTSILGYKEYAEAYGGWPTGYTTIAASTGINKGVSLSADTPLKRGQVAQMIYSTLTTPVLGVSEYSLKGNTYAPQDGSKSDFKTVLSDKFEGYAIEAKITKTPTSNPTSVEKGKVEIQLTKAAFTDEVQGASNKTPVGNNLGGNMYADIDVEPYFQMTGNAVIVKDADDEWHLVYFNAAKKDAKEYAAADLDDVDSSDGTNTIFKFGTGKEVKITTADIAASTTKVYVNNSDITTAAAGYADTDWETLIGAAQGNVKFTKNSNGKYDGIFIDYYLIGEVSTIKTTNDSTKINFTPINTLAAAILTVKARSIEITNDAVEEDKTKVEVIKNGEAAKLSDIAEDDIIAVYAAQSVLGTSAIKDPSNIKIVATDETDTGVLTAKSEDEYTFNDAAYKLTYGFSLPTQYKIGSSFTAALDPFGKICKAKDEVSADNYGLVLDYYDGVAKILTKDGTVKSYDVDTSLDPAFARLVDATFDYDTVLLSPTGTPDLNTKIERRVINYKVKGKENKITALYQADGTTAAAAPYYYVESTKTANNTDYKAVAKKVGTILLSDDSYIIDATKVPALAGTRAKIDTTDLSTFSALIDEVDYTAFAWDRTGTTDAFVIVTDAGNLIGADSRFAVAKSTTGSAHDDTLDETVYTVTALYNGEETTLKISDTVAITDCTGGSTTVNTLQGKAFYFTTDSDGLVDQIFVVFNRTAVNTATVLTNLGTNIKAADWDSVLGSTAKDIRLVYGLVSNVDSSSVTFVNPANVDPYTLGKNFIDMTDLYKFNFASDVAKYSYDSANTSSKMVDKISTEGLASSNFKAFEYKEDNSLVWKKDRAVYNTATPPVLISGDAQNLNIAKAADEQDWTDGANYAFAMIVNEQVVAIYQVVK